MRLVVITLTILISVNEQSNSSCTCALGTRKVMGVWGEGNFRAAGIFFVIKFLVWIFFLAIAWIFFRVNWRARIFFHLIFPCANSFFCISPAPPPPISFLMVRPLVFSARFFFFFLCFLFVVSCLSVEVESWISCLT